MRTVVTCSVLLACVLLVVTISGQRSAATEDKTKSDGLQLGNFSISLSVKDVQASKEFYEKLGFVMSGGDLKRKYVILQNANCTIGLYQGMFEKNSLTFNPGWDRNKQTQSDFQDVRELQRELKKRGLNPVVTADESTTGPAFFTLADPDGNPILIDQHVPKPARK